MLESEQFSKILQSYSSGISYKPVRAEVDPLALFPELHRKIVYTIQPIPSILPAEEFTKAKALAIEPVFILIPGREFDATGTRHGKGAGWYDRFLSMVPQEWLRIGFCTNDQFSSEPLVRESWDEPMDYVSTAGNGSVRILYTGAQRSKHGTYG